MSSSLDVALEREDDGKEEEEFVRVMNREKEISQQRVESFIREKIDHLSRCIDNGNLFINELTIPHFSEKTDLPHGTVDISHNFSALQKVLIHENYQYYGWDVTYCVVKDTTTLCWSPTFAFVFKFVKETTGSTGKMIFVSAKNLPIYALGEALYTIWHLQGMTPVEPNGGHNTLVENKLKENVKNFLKEHQPVTLFRLNNAHSKIKCTGDEIKDLRLTVNGTDYRFVTWNNDPNSGLHFYFDPIEK